MKLEHKVYLTLALAVLGGSGFCLSHQNETRATAGSLAATPKGLPRIALAKGDAERITKIDLTRPDTEDKSKTYTITLEKQGDDWEVVVPERTLASASKVHALIDNLKDLTLKEVIDSGIGAYDPFDLTDAKAMHVTAWKGTDKVSDLYFGKSDPRGQLVRVAGEDGVFTMAHSRSEGYAGFLYTRDLRSWRETSILKFDEENANLVEITNSHGLFSFSKDGDRWLGSRTRRVQGKLGQPEAVWTKFDESKVRDLLRNYKSLSADDFGEPADRAASGVDEAEQTGGVVRIRLKDDGGDRTIRVGKLSKRTSRWAIKDSRWAIKEGGDGTLYDLSPWTADWATADAGRFEGGP
jgi:hypothetical protein